MELGTGTYVLRHGTGITSISRTFGGALLGALQLQLKTPSGKSMFKSLTKGTAYGVQQAAPTLALGEIFAKYGQADTNAEAGYPTSDEFWSAGTRVQYFEGGRIAS